MVDQERLIREAVNANDPAIIEFNRVIAGFLAQAGNLSEPIRLQRGIAAISLNGINVPFHSSHLRPGVPSYRRFCQQRIQEGNIFSKKLFRKFIPNVMAKPFSLEDEYVGEAFNLTKSPVLKGVLEAVPVTYFILFLPHFLIAY